MAIDESTGKLSDLQQQHIEMLQDLKEFLTKHDQHLGKLTMDESHASDTPQPGIPTGPPGAHQPLQIDPLAQGMHAGGPGAPREGEVIPPSSPLVAQAIKRATAWMKERGQREPQPALEKNIQIMMRGGPTAEAIAKHMLKTFQPHPSEGLSPPTIEGNK